MSTALWNDQEDQVMARRNIEAISARMGYAPFRDFTQGGSQTVPSVKALVKLGTTIGDVWAVPASIGGVSITVVLVTSINICNTHTAPQAVGLYMIEPGQTAASVARAIFADTVLSNQSVNIRVPYILNTGATIRGLAALVADTVSVRVDALAFNAQPYGVTLKIVEGVALTGSLATIYTCPGAGVDQALLFGFTMCNTDTSPLQVEAHLVPSGLSAAVENKLWAATLKPKETVILEGYNTMVPGDFLQAKAATTSLVGFRPTILEIYD